MLLLFDWVNRLSSSFVFVASRFARFICMCNIDYSLHYFRLSRLLFQFSYCDGFFIPLVCTLLASNQGGHAGVLLGCWCTLCQVMSGTSREGLPGWQRIVTFGVRFSLVDCWRILCRVMSGTSREVLSGGATVITFRSL